MKVYFIVLGSSIASWRLLSFSGNSFAEGWSEPPLQKAGLSRPRTDAVSQTRPFRSIIILWLLARVFQICRSPQYADGISGFSVAACPVPSDSGIWGSRTGA